MPKILIIDDDPDFVLVSRIVLQGEGYQVVEACSGSAGLEVARQEHPDAILCDMMMSTPLEGADVCKRLAADADLKDIPVIMVTAIEGSAHAGELPPEALPIDAWISKPVHPFLLLRTIEQVLQ